MESQKFIVRADRAGVFFGEIESRNGSEVKMRNVRKIWYWDGASAVEQLAVDGVLKPNDCKFTVAVDEMEILGVIQVIPASEKAVNSIESVSSWKQ